MRHPSASDSLAIISGGQTGVDRGALDAALARGAPCGGWCPAGHRAEDGAIPPVYPLTPLDVADYRARTRANVRDSDATLIICPGAPTGGTGLTIAHARQLGRPCLIIDAGAQAPADAAAGAGAFIETHAIQRLNVAGPRASGWPDAANYTRTCLDDLLTRAPAGHVT